MAGDPGDSGDSSYAEITWLLYDPAPCPQYLGIESNDSCQKRGTLATRLVPPSREERHKESFGVPIHGDGTHFLIHCTANVDAKYKHG